MRSVIQASTSAATPVTTSPIQTVSQGETPKCSVRYAAV